MLTTSSRHPVWDRKTWWSQIILNLANFVRRLFSTKAATYLLLLLMLAYVGWELTRNIVVIESFGVPKQLEEQGYSGAVVSQRIADSIARIEAEVETREHKEQLSRSPEVEGLPDFEVPGTKLSLHSLIALLRELLHQQLPRISGELTLVPANPTIENSLDSRKPPLAAEVTIRISKRGDSQVPIKIQIPLRNPDDAIRPISNAILRRLNPYVLAVHQGSIGKDPRDALAITQELINDANDDSNSLQTAKYFNLRGLILVAAQEPDKAIYNFR